LQEKLFFSSSTLASRITAAINPCQSLSSTHSLQSIHRSHLQSAINHPPCFNPDSACSSLPWLLATARHLLHHPAPAI
jgi:hypothetical protein